MQARPTPPFDRIVSRLKRLSLACRWGALGSAALVSMGCLKTPDQHVASTLDVKKNPPASFELEGQPFCFGGSNNYYPIFKPRPVVDDLFHAAQALDMRVMRIWAMMDRGSLDGSVPNSDPDGGDKQGVYFQYWDPAKKAPAYNDGPNGLERLDYVLAKAGELKLKIIMVMVNNWRAFGGIDQYLMWYGREKHHEFFTAPEVKQAYKNWLEHVVMRTNTITGKPYREDPTIFSWELGNEPRCKGGNAFDRGDGWTTSTVTNWADEMSAYIKSLDSNHMVSVGDEGFLNGGGSHWAYQANDGVDNEALTGLRGIDFGTFHLYPEDWGAKLVWGEQWIIDHLEVGRRVGKPMVLEEYGAKVGRENGNLGLVTKGWPERRRAYRRWNELMLTRGGNGFMPWMLAGIDEDKPRYPDYDRYVFYKDDETGAIMLDYAKRFNTEAPACLGAAPATGAPSPFVRVRRKPVEVAVGWVRNEG
jgi:mannan endo-1,4-beta-mannosidase